MPFLLLFARELFAGVVRFFSELVELDSARGLVDLVFAFDVATFFAGPDFAAAPVFLPVALREDDTVEDDFFDVAVDFDLVLELADFDFAPVFLAELDFALDDREAPDFALEDFLVVAMIVFLPWLNKFVT